MTKWVIGTVKQIKYYTNSLFSLIINAPINTFIAGQFAKLGLLINGKKVHRAYSYVNEPINSDLEFYFVVISKGKFSSIIYTLKSGDNIMISKKSYGFFILNKIPSCDYLWMISTGTGIGPYLSILKNGKNLKRFKKIILINSVRYIKDISYISQIRNLQKFYNKKLIVQILISKEKKYGFLTGRIPDLIYNGLLELSVGFRINFKNTHIMLCGNPYMIYDTCNLLKKFKGMDKNSIFKHGSITVEQYW